MTNLKKCLSACLAALAVACGGNPAAPSASVKPPVTTTSTTLTFEGINPASGAVVSPVVGALVTSGGGVTVGMTDGSGSVAGTVTNPNHLVITKPGLILARNFSTSDAEGNAFSIAVFDASIRFDESLIANVNYNAYDGGGTTSTLRKATGDLWLHLGPQVSPGAFAAAAASASRTNQEAAAYLDHGSMEVSVLIDPSDACFADATSDACFYTNGRIICRTAEVCSRVALMTHEILHLFGWHHDAPGNRSIMAHIVNVRAPTRADDANGYYRVHRRPSNAYAEATGETSPGVSGARFQDEPDSGTCSGGR